MGMIGSESEVEILLIKVYIRKSYLRTSKKLDLFQGEEIKRFLVCVVEMWIGFELVVLYIL